MKVYKLLGIIFLLLAAIAITLVANHRTAQSQKTAQTPMSRVEMLTVDPALYGKAQSPNRWKGNIFPSSVEKTAKFIQAIESGCPMITISVHANKHVHTMGGARLYFYYDQGHWKECGTDKNLIEGLDAYRQHLAFTFHY